MNKIFGILTIMLVAICSTYAELHTWTTTTGKTVEGEYQSEAFETVYIEDAAGKLIKIPLEQLCAEDRTYVELLNPPVLEIGYKENIKTDPITADNWIDNGGGVHSNHQVIVGKGRFGAFVRQTSTKTYNHELTIEIFIFTEQYLDPDKYHLIARTKSKPFKLTKDNKFKYEFMDPTEYTIINYNLLSTWKRGEKASKYMILVRDERGEIIAHKSRSLWIFKNLDKLEKLPVGAWLNDRCIRVHPTSPESIRGMQ